MKEWFEGKKSIYYSTVSMLLFEEEVLERRKREIWKCSGVNFTNVLHACFAQTDPKSKKGRS